MDSKNKFWRGVTVGVLVTAFACLVTVGASAGIYMFGRRVIDNQVEVQAQQGSAGPAGEIETEGSFSHVEDKLSQIQNIIDQKYLYGDEIDAGKEETGIYRGFISGLEDPYAAYYTPEELASFLDETNGTYSGIGAMVSQNMQTVFIVRVFEDSPAEEGGMLPGDIIYKVDGVEMTGIDLTLVVNNYVKGEDGTDVTITVFREDSGEYVDLTMTRRKVDVQTVSGKMMTDEIGYIYVLEFDRITDVQFKTEIEELQKQGMEKLIVDLRDNPGGELTTVVSMADYILEDGGRIVTVANDKGGEDIYSAEDGHSLDIPMVVLVNENSASASEVFTGAMKDYGAATVVGVQTFGKGIVQTLIPLYDGSAIKLTTDHYYTPNGLDIHGKGIEPDVIVELDEELRKEIVIPEEKDNQLQEAMRILGEF